MLRMSGKEFEDLKGKVILASLPLLNNVVANKHIVAETEEEGQYKEDMRALKDAFDNLEQLLSVIGFEYYKGSV